MTKYRLRVKKIPLGSSIPLYEPKFPPLDNMYLDLIENKDKLKKNAPRPVFYRPPEQENEPEPGEHQELPDVPGLLGSESESEDILKELEKTYNGYESDDGSDSKSQSAQPTPTPTQQPQQQQPQSQTQPAQQPERPFYVEETQPEEDSEDKDMKEHADYLFKFMVLRRQYPNVEIPEFSDHSDLGTMKRVYQNVIRRVSLDSSVESYKKYLIGGFMVMEWVSVNWLGINISGFTAQQMKTQNSYDRLLLELGEKNYSPLGSRFPVEVRLLFMIVFNAGLFYVQKSVFSGSSDLLSMFTGGAGGASGGGNKSQQQSQSQFQPRRKMRGPTVSPEDIENLAKQRAESSSGSEN
jgi:hypothetical protein